MTGSKTEKWAQANLAAKDGALCSQPRYQFRIKMSFSPDSVDQIHSIDPWGRVHMWSGRIYEA